MSELPFDLLEEILIRVPVNDLLRFRCVCKTWKLLFQDERFISKHTTFAPSMLFVCGRNLRSSYVFEHADTSGKTNMIIQDGDLNLNDRSDKRFCVVGHCNGLFCLMFENSVVVWNPSLRESKTIPTLRHPYYYFSYPSSHFGFWYDHSINDYKILLIAPMPDSERYKKNPKFRRHAEILTLKSSPRLIDFPSKEDFYDHDCLSKRGALVGGYIFWHLDYYELGDTNEKILSFDIVSETINYSSSPCVVDKQILFLTPFRERLCVVQHLQVYVRHSESFICTEANVWFADHEELDMGRIKSWSKLFRLDLTDIKRSIHCGEVYEVNLEAVTKAGEFFLRLQCEYPYDYKVFAYNFEKKEFIEIKLPLDDNGEEQLVFEYEATLVPTHNIDPLV